MSKQASEETEAYRLRLEVDVLKEQVALLTKQLTKVSKVAAAMNEFGRIFGNYRGSDGRYAPGLITACFPRAGTIDVFVFDSSYSGGRYDITGIKLGEAKGEFMPYVTEDEEESEDEVAEDEPVLATTA